MEKLYHFEWRAPEGQEPDRWHTTSHKPYKTTVRAEGAALKWRADMAAEGCPVVCRVVELVSDGRNGRVAKPLFTVQ